MSQKSEFHNLDNPADGLFRELASGVTTRIFSGEHAMLSVVTLAPHAQGTLHHHPEEQWGVLLDGSAIRVQGDEEIPVKKGDFWRTPGRWAGRSRREGPPTGWRGCCSLICRPGSAGPCWWRTNPARPARSAPCRWPRARLTARRSW